MSKFLGANLPPGEASDEIIQVFNKHNIDYRISEDIGEITDFFQNSKESPENSATGGFFIHYKGHMVPVEPVIPQQEERHLNVTDAFMGTTSGSSNVVDASGDPGLAVNQGPEKRANPVFRLKRPLPESIQHLFPAAPGAKASKKEEVDEDADQKTEDDEGDVNEEEMSEEDSSSGDSEDEMGENEEEEETQRRRLVDRGVNASPPNYNDECLCPVCHGLYTPIDFGQHWLSHPRCEICEAHFEDEDDLDAHEIVHLTCESCGRTFANRAALLNHRAQVRRRRVLECTECHARFLVFRQLFTHHRRLHAEPNAPNTPAGSPRQ